MRRLILHAFYVFCFSFLLSSNLNAQSDEPCSATQLTVGTNGTCGTPINGCTNPPTYTNSTSASSGVTLPANNCGGFNSSTLDFWFKAVVPASGRLSIVVSENGTGAQVTTFWDMALYTSSNPNTCTGSTFTQIASECNTGVSPSINVTQPAGTVVYIRMWREAASAQTANRCYSICATETPASPPPCTTMTAPANGASVPGPDVTLSWNAAPGATSYEVFLGTTNPPSSIGVTPNTTATISGLAFNTTYYWYVGPRNVAGSATGCNSTIFSFTTQAPPPPPANDECVNAIQLYANGTVSGSTISATQSRAAEACAGFTGNANDDVWYKFTTVQAGNASFTLTPTGALDAVIHAYSGTCAALVNIGCADSGVDGDPETISLTGLSASTTYYLRIYGYDGAGSEGSFSIIGTGTALPVTLTNLKGERLGSFNKLSWTTVNEQNNKGFEIERSVDGIHFSSLNFIASKGGNGNSATSLNYSFSDAKPFSGNNYYRLKQIDIDGKVSHSNVVLLKGERVGSLTISSVYPNPSKEKLNLIAVAPANDNINVIITDLAGKVVMQISKSVLAGDNNISIEVSNLPSGSYILKAVCTNGCEAAVTKFVKQ